MSRIANNHQRLGQKCGADYLLESSVATDPTNIWIWDL